jgi:hypothetical protein
MSVMSEPNETESRPVRAADMLRAKRGRNLAVLLAIFSFCALFYLITIIRMFK